MQDAQFVRQIEQQYLQQQLAAMPTLPWLWLAPAEGWGGEGAAAARGIRLQREGDSARYRGDLRCGLPLPLPAESINAIVLQHIGGSYTEALLAECARVLMPGGRLWLSLFNPCSPYRLHWQWHRGDAPSMSQCRAQLQRHGLHCTPVRYLGPLWSAGQGRPWPAPHVLRAVCVLEASKRSAAMIGPAAVARPRRLPQPLTT